jgi:isoaspartyl peptidase/L-asparaginase-like protein (Ntn-hydrolase superfamily)
MTTLLATWAEPGKVAIDAAWAARLEGADLLSTLEKGLAAAELDPSLIAIGLGSLPNADGELELDAAIMDGKDLSAGAVCGVRGIVPVISVARRVKEETPHVMLAGDQARRFAIERGFRPTNLMTSECIAKYEDWLRNPDAYAKTYLHAVPQAHGDTVTMLGLESDGRCAAASSTSGWAFKMPGRVGDSPIVGAGIYADDEAGCAGATGLGEELWKAAASFRTVEGMRQGMSAQEACEATIRQMLRRQPASRENMCVVIALRKDGDFGAACTKEEFPLWVCQGGETRLQWYPNLMPSDG